MTKRLLIILANVDPHDGVALSAPLFQAVVAAALEFRVEVLLTGRTAELAKQGVADQLHLLAGGAQTVQAHLADAREAGVEFRLCTPTPDLWGCALIPEITEIVGGAYVIEAAMQDDTVTFTY